MWRTLVVEVVLLSSSLMSCLSWSRVMSKLSGLSTRRKMPWMFLISLKNVQTIFIYFFNFAPNRLTLPLV